MRGRAFVVAVLLVVAFAAPASAGQIATPTATIDCTAAQPAIQQPIIGKVDGVVWAEYCAATTDTLADVVSWQHNLYIDGVGFILSGPGCVFVPPVVCISQLPPLAVTKLSLAGPHFIQASFTSTGVEGPRSVAYQSTALASSLPPVSIGCMYQSPVAGAVLEMRPPGQMMQGFNPIGPSGVDNNQASRIAQLEAWGWRVLVSQFVDGSARVDKTDRLFLIIKCPNGAP